MADEYTQSRSRPGAKLNTGTDDRQLFLVEFGEMVLEAWDEVNNYQALTFERTISSGKAMDFPIIGRKRDATEHEPGALVLGGTIEHNDVTITLDKLLYDAVFIAEVDELMADYDLAGPYARQLGESLSTAYDRRVATMHILASRVATAPYTGGPVPSYYYNASVATDPSKLEEAGFKAVEYMRTNDVGVSDLHYKMPWAQYLLLARYAGFQGGVPGSAQAPNYGQQARQTAVPFPIAGTTVEATNHVPNTNVTTGPTKFRGDFSTTIAHISNKMAVGTLNSRGLKVVMDEKPDRFGTLLIASKFCGHGILRAECSFEVANAARS